MASESQKSKFTDAFQAMDKSHKGYLTIQELHQYSLQFGRLDGEEQIKKEFGGKDSVNLQEFIELNAKHWANIKHLLESASLSADELVEKEKVLTGFRQVFDRFDVDKDGTVTEYEALKIANEILGLGLDSVVEHVSKTEGLDFDGFVKHELEKNT